jgi:hypothetical protein
MPTVMQENEMLRDLRAGLAVAAARYCSPLLQRSAAARVRSIRSNRIAHGGLERIGCA